MGVETERIYTFIKDENSKKFKNHYRVLVDRIWPRGVSKDKAALDEWNKEIAPSDELRKWFNHEDDRFNEFQDKYIKELEQHAEDLDRLAEIASAGQLLLLYGAKNEKHNQAVVLQQLIKNKL